MFAQQAVLDLCCFATQAHVAGVRHKMIQDRAASEEAYERFLRRVKSSEYVWGLKSEDGWAFCPSHDKEDTDVLVFWSDRAYATQHAVEDWHSYVPEAIPLKDFIDRWIPGMHEDRVLVGPNWDSKLCGLEITPIKVGKDLTSD